MKSIFILPLFLFINIAVLAQKSTEILPNSIILPRLSTTEQNTVPPQQAGNIIYNADEKKLALHDGTNWNYLSSSIATNGFKHSKIFTYGESWTVPAGVTKIQAELWGGGNSGDLIGNIGANFDCKGGRGSCYALFELNVIPNEVLDIEIGIGGVFNDGILTFGRPSMIKRAATTIAKASVQPSDSQGFDSLLKLFIGEDGQNATFSFQQVDTGVFRKVVQTGAGGGTYPYFNNGGKSASLEYSVPAGILIGETGRLKYYGLFGGGSACANSFFNAGSQGLVIIYY